ncbi:MAG: ABC transporter ATP-binding protein [Moheibacter sp.]
MSLVLFGVGTNISGMRKELLKIENLSVGYSQPICTRISTTVNEGELVGLAGRNGSGKSTLIKTLLGILPKKLGNIYLQGNEISSWDEQKRSKTISVVFSRLDQIPPVTVEELVCLGRLPYKSWLTRLDSSDKKIVKEALELVGIGDIKNKFASELSDGQLQMVMIARALAQQTQLVLLDEPTSHLDIENQFKIFELIYRLSKETKKAFIISSHQIELLIQNTTQLWWVNQGEFFAGFPEKIVFEQKIFEKLSQEKIYFDYNSGKFEFQYPKNQTIHFETDGTSLAYWMKHALERNGFSIVPNAKLELELENNTFKINEHTFEDIQTTIEYLQQLNL